MWLNITQNLILKNANIPSVEQKWSRLFGQYFIRLKWILAGLGLSTAPLAAP